MTFTSSPPRGPCSASHSSPVDRMPRESLRVAVAVAPDARHARRPPATNGLSSGTRPSSQMRWTLPLGRERSCASLPVPALADGEEQVALAVEHEARAEVHASGAIQLGRARCEDRLLLDERPSRSLPRTTAVIADAVRAGVAVGEVDPAVLRVVGMHGDVEQAALALRPRRPACRGWARAASGRFSTDAQPARLFRSRACARRAGTPGPRRRRARSVTVSSLNACSSLRTELSAVGLGERGLRAPRSGALLADVDDERADVLRATAPRRTRACPRGCPSRMLFAMLASSLPYFHLSSTRLGPWAPASFGPWQFAHELGVQPLHVTASSGGPLHRHGRRDGH